MAAVNAAIEREAAHPFRWGVHDCLSLAEAVHGFTRSDIGRLPRPEAYRRGEARWGSLLRAYEMELIRGGLVMRSRLAPPKPSDVAVVRLPPPEMYGYAVADESCTLLVRMRRRLISLPDRSRIASLWGPA